MQEFSLSSFASHNYSLLFLGECQPADLGFILDMSQTTKSFHQQEIKIIQGIVNRFDVKIGGSQACLLTFSDSAVMRVASGQISQGEQFNKLVSNISHTSTVYLHFPLPLHCLHGLFS